MKCGKNIHPTKLHEKTVVVLGCVFCRQWFEKRTYRSISYGADPGNSRCP